MGHVTKRFWPLPPKEYVPFLMSWKKWIIFKPLPPVCSNVTFWAIFFWRHPKAFKIFFILDYFKYSFFMSLQYTFSSFNWTYNTYSIFTAFIINLNHSILELFHILFLGTPVQSGRGENNSRFSVVGTKEKESSYSPVYNKYLTSQHSSNQRYWDRTSSREPSSYLSKTSPLQRNR